MIRARVEISDFNVDRVVLDAMANYENRARQRIAGFRCPEHRQTPTIVTKGKDGFPIHACCEEHAKRALRRATQ